MGEIKGLKSQTLYDIAKLVEGTIVGKADNFIVTGLAALDRAGPGDISFLTNPKYRDLLTSTQAGAVLVSGSLPEKKSSIVFLQVKDAYLALARLLQLFHPPLLPTLGVHDSAVIDPDAELAEGVKIGSGVSVAAGAVVGENTSIFPGVYVGENASIGSNCIIYSNVSIYHEIIIGNRVIIHAGAVIGSDGFGFAREGARYVKIPQIGSVHIHDDVEIGANCTIDRGSMGMTIIKRGVKLDNLCHLAHNVILGEDTAIAGQAGISGSTTVGERVMIGGQAGFAGHISIGDDVIVTGRTGVVKSIPDGQRFSGFPAFPHREWRRAQIAMRHAPDMISDIRKLKDEIAELNNKIDTLCS